MKEKYLEKHPFRRTRRCEDNINIDIGELFYEGGRYKRI
jgi:hypothetical protein